MGIDRFLEAQKKENFKRDCKVIKLQYEYPGYTGIEKFAIISELNYEQILEIYGAEVKRYIPFIWLSTAMGETIHEYKRNEDKFAQRMRRYDIVGFDEAQKAERNIELSVADFTEALLQDHKKEETVRMAFLQLSKVQQRRVKAYVLEGKNFTEIAKEEGKDRKTIYESYNAAIKKMKKSF